MKIFYVISRHIIHDKNINPCTIVRDNAVWTSRITSRRRTTHVFRDHRCDIHIGMCCNSSSNPLSPNCIFANGRIDVSRTRSLNKQTEEFCGEGSHQVRSARRIISPQPHARTKPIWGSSPLWWYLNVKLRRSIKLAVASASSSPDCPWGHSGVLFSSRLW